VVGPCRDTTTLVAGCGSPTIGGDIGWIWRRVPGGRRGDTIGSAVRIPWCVLGHCVGPGHPLVRLGGGRGIHRAGLGPRNVPTAGAPFPPLPACRGFREGLVPGFFSMVLLTAPGRSCFQAYLHSLHWYLYCCPAKAVPLQPITLEGPLQRSQQGLWGLVTLLTGRTPVFAPSFFAPFFFASPSL